MIEGKEGLWREVEGQAGGGRGDSGRVVVEGAGITTKMLGTESL